MILYIEGIKLSTPARPYVKTACVTLGGKKCNPEFAIIDNDSFTMFYFSHTRGFLSVSNHCPAA